MREEDPANIGHSYNKLCNETGCKDIPSNWQEALNGNTHLKLGKRSEIGHSETVYPYPTSPMEECYTGVLWDCDGGPRAAIYYHVLPSATAGLATDAGYNYIDYWFFYRFNHFPIDDHEGDWEGLTVAPSVANPSVFDFAIFAQHNSASVYAPENLQCDGGAGCGTKGTPTGQRVWDFVALGSHASYPNNEGNATALGTCTRPLASIRR
jgi:hypothetical protein